MPVLIHELISAELWREKIFTQLIKMDFQPNNSFIIYLIVIESDSYFKPSFKIGFLFKFDFKLYHEATLVNLLETVLFHQDVCQSLGDSLYDLIDYCYRKLTEQLRIQSSQEAIKQRDEETKKSNEIMEV